MKFPINEIFHTFQGEGCHMGRPAAFVRFHGCPLRCSFCDSAGTWHPDYVPKGIPFLSAEEILQRVSTDYRTVILTGGEPAIWNLHYFCQLFLTQGHLLHIETSGAFPLNGAFNWITVSPKKAAPLLEDVAKKASEFKIIVESPEDIPHFLSIVAPMITVGKTIRQVPIWLHPEWSQRENPAVLDAITTAVKDNARTGGLSLRAGWQIHKQYRADLLDKGSRPAVPLGGNPDKGY